MLAQILSDTLQILRRPTSQGFQNIARPNILPALLYFGFGNAVIWVALFFVQTQEHVRLLADRAEYARSVGEGIITRIFDAIADPAALGIIAAVITLATLVMWVVLPLAVGRWFGGMASLRTLIYQAIICWVAIFVPGTLLLVLARSILGLAVIPVLLAFHFFYGYSVYVILRSTAHLSAGGALIAAMTPFALVTVLAVIGFAAVLYVFLDEIGMFEIGRAIGSIAAVVQPIVYLGATL